jgi:uncharacterized protein YbjT (DUF2867 family)
MTVLVTGASGNVGGAVAAAFLDAGLPVRVLTRGAEQADRPDRVEVFTGDLSDPASVRGAWSGVESVFLLPGFEGTPQLLADARQAGVRHVTLLSGSSAGDPDSANAITRYMSVTEGQVSASGLSYTILRPAAFMSNALRWAGQLSAGNVVEEPFADVPTAVIDPADIAAAAVAVSREPDRASHAGAVYRLSGPEALRPAERLEVLAEVLGRPLRLEPLSNEAARERMSGQMPAAYVDAFFDFYVHGSLDESIVYPAVAELTGRPARTFREWALAHAGAFK